MISNNIIKRTLFLILLSIIIINAHAQTGLNFQGVARTTNNVILASQAITIKLSILQGSATGTADYTETRKVTTNAQGLFTAVIGDTGAISSLGNFTTINWKLTPKFLKIEMDAAAGTNFITMGTTQFQYVAYAQFAKSVDAENIVGIVPVTLGGTGVNSLTGLKTALTLNNVNNTLDLNKPISTITQTALDLKLNAADTSKYTKQTYSDSTLVAKQVLIGLKLDAADTSKYTKQTYTDSALLIKLSITGNAVTASTASKLATARTINGVAFDGSGDITITADAGTLTGTSLKSIITGSSLTSVGTLTNLTVTNPIVGSITGNATTATTAGNITATTNTTLTTLSSLTSLGTLTNLTVTNPIVGSITGNATTATTAGNITATTNTTLTSLSSLAAVGTITSGVWSGTAVAVVKGGTGLTSAGTNGQVLTSTGSGTLTWTGTHYIGESYGGGKVFYVYDNGKHGLIAATSDQSIGIRWYGGTYTYTRARGDGVGAGLKNTAIIIAVLSGIYTPTYDGNAFAATVCNEYSVTETVGGITTIYGDWYLPSKHELNLMYTNIGQGAPSPNTNIGGFSNSIYWSSTDYGFNLAWYQFLNSGGQGIGVKDTSYYVRAIRAF